MSVIEDGGPAAGGTGAVWTGYGLAAIGTALGVAYLLRLDDLAAAALLVVAPATLLVAASAPEAFEVRWRVSRMLNPVLGAPSLFVMIMGGVHHLVDPTLAWIGAGVGAAAFLALSSTRRSRPNLDSPIAMVIVFSIFGGLYGYGAPTVADVQFDRSAPTAFQVPIVGKYETRERSSTTHYLRIGPWGGGSSPVSVDVSERAYAVLGVGDSVCVLQRPGALGIAWFTVRPCSTSRPG